MKRPFIKGEEVVKGAERGRIQMRQNHSTKEWFPVVVILNGSRVGQSEYPSRGWKHAEDTGDYDRPDYDDDGLSRSELRDMVSRPWRFREGRD